MATALTADAMLAALAKWGIAPKFQRPDWRTHNRDAVQGWGPLFGFVVHNFGSDGADSDALAYLYNGDTARGMPGPLSQFAITDDGQLWVIGWGTANHTGSIGASLLGLVQNDAAPLDRDVVPTTTFSNKTGVLAINKNFIGVEMTYGKAPTAAQRATLVRLGAALMDALGDGYTGGSVVGHRECDSQRSDPVGVPMWQLRRDINALLKAGPSGSKPAPTPAPAPVAPLEDDMPTPADLWSYQMTSPDGKVKADAAAFLVYTNAKVDAARAEFKAQIEGLTAAVQALAQSQGADASSIADIVDKAVRDRLAQVKFDVTDAPA